MSEGGNLKYGIDFWLKSINLVHRILLRNPLDFSQYKVVNPSQISFISCCI
jgi:hypothetical protein